MTPSQTNISAASPLEECPPMQYPNPNLTPAECEKPEKPSAKFRVINATLPQTRFIVDGINTLIASDEESQVVNIDGVVSVKINKPSYLMALLGLCKIECKSDDDATVAFILPDWLEVAR